MRGLLIAFTVMLLVSVAACAPEGEPWSNPPVSSAPGSGPQQPQPPGSLPPGAVVNAPIATPGGELMRVGAPTQGDY